MRTKFIGIAAFVIGLAGRAHAQSGEAPVLAPGLSWWWLIAFSVLFLLALLLSLAAWRNSSNFAKVEDRMRRAVSDRRHAEEALNAVLLDRAAGAAIWDGDRLQLVTGCAESVRDLADPTDPFAVATALVREEAVAEMSMLLDALLREGQGFEETFIDAEGIRRDFVGRAIGARILLTIADIRRGDEGLPSLVERVEFAEARAQALEAGFGAAPVYAWRRDSSGRLDWANQRFVDGVEAPSLDAALDCQIELLSGQDGKKVRDLAAAARAERAPQTARYPTIIDGERRTLEISEMPFENGTIGFAIDVSAQVGASEALLRQIDANRETLSRLQRGIALFDADGRMNFNNETAAETFGIDRSILDSHPTMRQLLNALREVNRVPQARSFASWRDEFVKNCTELTEKTEPLERIWHLPDGTVMHVIVQRHPGGGMMMVTENVTKFHLLKREAATASAVYRAAFSRLTEGVIVIGLDGGCRLANEAFAKLWRVKPEQIEDTHISEIVKLCSPLFGDQAIWNRMIGHVSAATEAREIWKQIMERTDGSVLGMMTAPLPDGATMFAFRDITDSVNKERVLVEQNETLKKVANLKSQFLRTIHSASHELKIPLNTIVGFSEILGHEMYGELNRRQHEYIDGIYTASNDLRQLIGGIIDLAMLENDYFAFRIEAIDVREMLESAVSFIRRNKGPDTSIRIDCPDPVGEIAGDAPRFREIAHTLLEVVRRNLIDRDTIEIGARRDKDHVTIWIGADRTLLPDNLREILMSNETPESVPEFGRLALSVTLVRQFIERQGGSISMQRGIGGTREAVVYRLLVDDDAVRAAINQERPREMPDAAE